MAVDTPMLARCWLRDLQMESWAPNYLGELVGASWVWASVGRNFQKNAKGGVSEVKRLGWGTGASEGADSNFPRQEGTPFPGDKGPLVEDRQGLESDSAPERPPGISAGSSQRTGRDPAPCVWEWGHQAE